MANDKFRALRRSSRSVVAWLALAGVFFVGRSSFADHYRVPSGSMSPTVEVGDHVIVEKLAYGLRIPMTHDYLVRTGEPRRGDVVVLDSPDDDIVLLKRVVAVPGDRVEVRGGQLDINEQPVPIELRGDQWYEREGDRLHPIDLAMGGGPDFGPVTVPPDSYLVLGDNRGNSRDGRFFGWVARSRILGRAEGIIWRAGRLTWKPL